MSARSRCSKVSNTIVPIDTSVVATSQQPHGRCGRAARSAPLAVGRQVHDSMLDCSPGKHVPYDRRTQGAVNRLVRKSRRDVMVERIPGVGVDGSEGSMNRLAKYQTTQ